MTSGQTERKTDVRFSLHTDEIAAITLEFDRDGEIIGETWTHRDGSKWTVDRGNASVLPGAWTTKTGDVCAVCGKPFQQGERIASLAYGDDVDFVHAECTCDLSSQSIEW